MQYESESESGSGGNEYARARRLTQASVRAEAGAKDWARVLAKEEARAEAEVRAERARAQAVKVLALERAGAEARAERARAQAAMLMLQAQAKARPRAEAEVRAKSARAQERGGGPDGAMLALARAQATERAEARAREGAEARAERARAQAMEVLVLGRGGGPDAARANGAMLTLARAQATARAEARAREGAEVRAERERAQALKVLVWGRGGAWSRPAAQARAKAAILALTRAEAKAQAELRARAEAEVEAEAWAPLAPAEALVRALAEAREGVMDEASLSLERAIELLAEAQNEWWIKFMLPAPTLPHSYRLTYAEALADWKIKDIVNSIMPGYRHELALHLSQYSEHFWLIQIVTPVTRLPLELLQQIFSTIIDASGSPSVLMLVCKYWYTIVTGIWASLKLGTGTPRDIVARKLERNPRLLDIVVDTEIDRGDFNPSEAAFEAIFASIEATSRWRSLVVETLPREGDLPEHLVDCGLQRYSNATLSRLRSFKIKRACEVSPLLERLLRILGTTASAELSTVEINSANVISFLVLTYSPFFRFVKVLFLDISGMHDPVDLLPHLHQLETLTASRLSLPIYGHDIELPFVNTLRHLTLRAVSIQWMSGRTFEVLESCTITFPPHPHTLPIVGTTLPNCKQLTLQGHSVDILDGISAHNLINLSVTCSASFNRRGDRQLVWFSSQALRESRFAPRILHISIEATNRAWMNALALMSDLEELVIGSARPSSLGVKVLQLLIVQPAHASNTGETSTPEGRDPPLCPSLRRFGLKYRRWLRSSEHFNLVPTFGSIILSRGHANCALQSFRVWKKSDEEDPLELVGPSRFVGFREGELVRFGGRNEQGFAALGVEVQEGHIEPRKEAFDPSS